MRLFIAINLAEEAKDILCHTIETLKGHALHGSYTLPENLHITLVFIGETDRADDIIRAMDTVQAGPFVLSIEGLGRFRRSEGDIYWTGIRKNDALNEIYDRLYEELIASGFLLEERKFKPHLTLARKVTVKYGFNMDSFSKGITPVKMKVNNISLMRSRHINGKLTYTETFKKDL